MRFLFVLLFIFLGAFPQTSFAQKTNTKATNKTIEKKPTLETIEDTTQAVSRVEL